MLYVPSVIEQTPRGERSWDLFSRLLQSRIIFIGSEINDTVASLVMGQLLYLQNEDPDEDIDMYINTPGGEVPAGLAIYDTMQLVRPHQHLLRRQGAEHGGDPAGGRGEGQAHSPCPTPG